MNKQATFYRELNRMALPLAMSSFTGVLLGLVDQMFVGHISINAYAGVGLVSSCINSLIGVLGAFSIAFNIRGSRLLGEQNEKQFNEEFSVFLIICGCLGIVLFVTFNILCYPILQNVFALEGDTLREAGDYLRIFSLSIPLNLLLFIYSTVFKISKKTGHIFIVTLFINIIAVLLDYVLIFGKFGLPRMGTKGAALGSVLSLFLYLLIYAFLGRKYARVVIPVSHIASQIKDILTFSFPLLGQEFMEDILFVVGINMIIARIGTIELSVYTLLLQIISIVQMPMFGYSTAETSLISEAYGEKNLKQIHAVKKNALQMAWLCFFIMSSIVVINSENIIRFITDEIDVLFLAERCLPVVLLTQFINYGAVMEKTALQCIGYSKYTLIITFIINLGSLLIMNILTYTLFQVYMIFAVKTCIIFLILYRKYRASLLSCI